MKAYTELQVESENSQSLLEMQFLLNLFRLVNCQK